MRKAAAIAQRPFAATSSEAGLAVLLVVGMIGLVLGLFLVAASVETRNRMAEGQLALANGQMRQAGQSSVRLFEQYVRAGWVRADCGKDSLKPMGDAPPSVSGRFQNDRFLFNTCEARVLKGAKSEGVFKADGRAPSLNDCGAVAATRLAVKEAHWDDRYVIVGATTSSPKKDPLNPGLQPQEVRARVNLPPPPVPGFGLLVNDLHCGMCHVRVNGDVASTSPVRKFHENKGSTWQAYVAGAWYAASFWNPSGGGGGIAVGVRDGVRQYYSGPKLPGRYTKQTDGNVTFKPEFPKLAAGALGPYVNPDPFSCETRSLDVKPGNVVMIGKSKTDPIVLKGDIHVRGDLVITGWYSGVGTIYVDGNVYIPFDLRAVRSIFPYDDDPAKANAAALASVRGKLHDGLAIATRRSIVIGEFDDNGVKNKSVWYHDLTPPDKRGDVLGIKKVYDWYPDGKTGYAKLFGRAWNCKTNSAAGHVGSINLIDAYLYAQNTIGGLARRNSYAINGGIIADNYHVVSASRDCRPDVHPVHGQSMKWSYVNYDYRMKHGLPLLTRFADYFLPP